MPLFEDLNERLMPQCEHIVREVLTAAGALTTTHDPQNRLDTEIALPFLTLSEKVDRVYKHRTAIWTGIQARACKQSHLPELALDDKRIPNVHQ